MKKIRDEDSDYPVTEDVYTILCYVTILLTPDKDKLLITSAGWPIF